MGCTEEAQSEVEEVVLSIYRDLVGEPVLERALHVSYLRAGLLRLSPGHASLDASRPWLVYWITHSLALLGEPLPASQRAAVVRFLVACRSPTGGFGGGRGQAAHLATTYAAVAALATVGGGEAMEALQREALAAFLARLKLPGGGFAMTEGGEADTRGCYTALAVSRLAGLPAAALGGGVGDFVASCQTHEGGLGGEPWAEAHGGYTFCGLAAATLAGCAHRLDLRRLRAWAASQQGRIEGGFAGRTHKVRAPSGCCRLHVSSRAPPPQLVDGCYSFWVGALFPLLEVARAEGEAPCVESGAVEHLPPGPHASSLFPPTPVAPGCPPRPYNARALQAWLLACCQAPTGGMRDKPGKGPDFYHTCYCLSGLSIAQHTGGDGVVGPPANVVRPTDTLLNVEATCLEAWFETLAQHPLTGHA